MESSHCSKHAYLKKKSKAVPVTDLEGLQHCVESMMPHFLVNRFIDGGEVANLKHKPRCTPQKDSWYQFLLEAE
jgi:hypothetical protein